MPFEPRQITLKDHRTVTLRAATPQDAEPFTVYANLLRASTLYVVTSTDEAKPVDKLAEEIQNLHNRPGSILILAIANPDQTQQETVVGDCGMYAMRPRRMAHVADLGMGCDQHYRSVGLGTALLAAAIDHARAHPALRRLELGVFSDNTAGLKLYNRLGFNPEGLRPQRFSRPGVQPQAGYDDEIIMGLDVSTD